MRVQIRLYLWVQQGESATLSIEENVKVIEKTVELAKGRIPIIAGTGANATSEAIVMTKLLRDSGVAGCLSVVPYYNKTNSRRHVSTF